LVYEELSNLLSVIILAVAVAGGAQFFLGYWRALLIGMASQPLSEKFFVAAGFHHAGMRAEDFGRLFSLHQLMPDVKGHPNTVWRLRAHYFIARMIKKIPLVDSWAHRELSVCSSCLAVLVDQRLALNLACAAQARTY
jgi:hypothetical protein